ncbi:hypothetical protein [Saccharothrix sp. HUAS TT1]|uniref:hypothetical protein n=1 Tax=unclassified Saccharothrix TaxID=2593673 RepID=UPI00345BCB46
MTQTDPKLVAEIDAIEDEVIGNEAEVVVAVGGGDDPNGGPYKPVEDDPEVQPLIKPMGGPYKPVSDPVEAK